MSQSTTERDVTPVDQQIDPEVVALRRQFEDRSPLDQLVQEGARRMLQEAINAEVESFIDEHRDRRDEQGRRLVVKNGNLPPREILTGAGPIEVAQGRVRDNSPDRENRVVFTPRVLPAYLRRTDAIEELIPWLYLKGISTGDFGEPKAAACQCLSKDRDELLTFYDFPAEHWGHLRTTNPIESTFATIRLRHRKTKGNGTRRASLAMMFKLAQSASRKWRRLNSHEKIPLVIAGRTFQDGILQQEPAASFSHSKHNN